jgi:hypothetical protein
MKRQGFALIIFLFIVVGALAIGVPGYIYFRKHAQSQTLTSGTATAESGRSAIEPGATSTLQYEKYASASTTNPTISEVGWTLDTVRYVENNGWKIFMASGTAICRDESYGREIKCPADYHDLWKVEGTWQLENDGWR